MPTYLLANSKTGEFERLAQLEALYDPVTIRRIKAFGIQPGWKCLVPGAGGGSVVRWLSERVGDVGEVLATDIDPRFIQGDQPANVHIQLHDISADSLPNDAFDFAHVRMLLMHLSDPVGALRKIAASLRPGGCVLVEEYDTFCVEWSDSPVIKDFWGRVEAAWSARGLQFSCGRALGSMATEIGLKCLWLEADPRSYPGGSREARFQRMTALRVRESLTGKGLLSSDQFDVAMEAFTDSSKTLTGPTLVAMAACRQVVTEGLEI